MKTFRILLVALASLFVNTVSAGTYVVDTQKRDSLQAYELRVINGKEAVAVPLFCIANGDTLTVSHQIDGFPDYAAVRINGKYYAVPANQLCFVDEGGEDPWNTWEEKWRTPRGRYYSTLTPYLMVVALVVGALLLGLLGLICRPVRHIARLLVPIMIAVACYLEINAWLALQSDMFWWCDKDIYGFWGSVLRVLPFSLVLGGQLASYPIYKMLIFDRDKEETGATSILPMSVSFVVAIPVIFIVLLVCAIFHMGKPMQSYVGLGLLTVIVGLGSLTSIVINVKALGLLRGLWFTVFGAIYTIGAMIAVVGLGTALWHLFVQMLITVAPWALLFMILTSRPAEPDPNRKPTPEEIAQKKREKEVEESNRRHKEEEEKQRWRWFQKQREEERKRWGW